MIPSKNFSNIWAEALKAGEKALVECAPKPMIVQQHANMLDDSSPVKASWFVSDGVCGFAWVGIKPATSSFARWLKAKGYARRDSYNGGLLFWVREGGQSLERKVAYAEAMVNVLGGYGILAYVGSRMD